MGNRIAEERHAPRRDEHSEQSAKRGQQERSGQSANEVKILVDPVHVNGYAAANDREKDRESGRDGDVDTVTRDFRMPSSAIPRS